MGWLLLPPGSQAQASAPSQELLGLWAEGTVAPQQETESQSSMKGDRMPRRGSGMLRRVARAASSHREYS